MQWLIPMLRDGAASSNLGKIPANDVVEQACWHGVEGWTRQRLGPGIPALDRAVFAAVARHQRSLSELERASCALRKHGVGFLVVKGPAVVALHGSPLLRSYVDLDLLVRPQDLPDAVDALLAVGFTVLDANWPLLRRARVHELRLLGLSRGAVDLHWSLTSPTSGLGCPDVEALMARGVEVEIGGHAYPTLGFADTLVHLAVHAAASGGHRLIWLKDMEAAVAKAAQECGPGELVQVVDEWDARPAVDLMLRRAHRTLGLAVPSELRGLVAEGAWSVVVTGADRVSPPALSGPAGSLSRLLARSCRATPAASLAALRAKSLSWARGRANGIPSLGAHDLLDPANPGSALYPVGGDEAMRTFLREVSSPGYVTNDSRAAAPSAGRP